jgi:putative Mn2+ efflux pump MntP
MFIYHLCAVDWMHLYVLAGLSIFSLFAGFAIGRFSDKWGGHLPTPHHWIYGLILVVFGIYYIRSALGVFGLSFRIGHFVSDLDDFLHMRVFGRDVPHRWKFWSIK